jgi:hypothetical protein
MPSLSHPARKRARHRALCNAAVLALVEQGLLGGLCKLLQST